MVLHTIRVVLSDLFAEILFAHLLLLEILLFFKLDINVFRVGSMESRLQMGFTKLAGEFSINEF